ncbi:MAG TPA: iron-containing alcohol dehydrogenase [Fibrobacteria bacterium]|nr:iron-containing alcohol dehydrogenase [Fibrobacteria bacterium]
MPILFGAGAVDRLPDLLLECKPDRVFILSDQHVFHLHGAALLQLLSPRFAPEIILIGEGEGEKKMSNLEFLCQQLFERGVTKSSVIVNFGGGVTLNIGGLAASLVYRGIRFLQVPTTLMAQSDVIVSNKQGINFAGGKNRLGAFSTPVAAVADSRYYRTEPLRQLRAAAVEYCKNAILLGGEHYEEALRFFSVKDTFSEAQLERLLVNSLAQKFEIARLDPREKGLGLMLEYGHTVGHALEWLSQGRLMHGEAVYHGMNVAGQLALHMGIMPVEELKKQSLLLSRLSGIPPIPNDISVGQILTSVQRDNKKVGKGMAFILMKAVGEVNKPENPDGAGKGESVLTPVCEFQLNRVLLEYWDALL